MIEEIWNIESQLYIFKNFSLFYYVIKTLKMVIGILLSNFEWENIHKDVFYSYKVNEC